MALHVDPRVGCAGVQRFIGEVPQQWVVGRDQKIADIVQHVDNFVRKFPKRVLKTNHRLIILDMGRDQHHLKNFGIDELSESHLVLVQPHDP